MIMSLRRLTKTAFSRQPGEREYYITPEHKLLDLHIRETLSYKDLILVFVRRDFTVKYKQTILGPLWAIIQPLLTTIVFTVLFGNLARLTTLDTPDVHTVPGFLFYMSGSICWSYFSVTLDLVSGTFLNHRGTMGKVYYPRLVTPVATAVSTLVKFSIQFAMFIAVWLYCYFCTDTDIHVTPWLLLLPLCVLQMMVLAVGFGIIVSSVTTKYRDLAMLVGFGLQLWQYATPVAYGLTLIPERLLPWYLINPTVSIVTTFRKAAFGFGFFDLHYYLISWAVSIVLLAVGLVMFSRIERNFMDTI